MSIQNKNLDFTGFTKGIFESYKKANDLMEENKDRFFELFSKYFFCLWD